MGNFLYKVVMLGNVKDRLDNVVDHDAAKRVLHMLIQLPIQHCDQFQHSTLAKTGCLGVLMYSPLGMGKTMLACVTAKDASACFMAMNPLDVKHMAHGQMEQFIKGLFKMVRMNALCIMFLGVVDVLFNKCDFDHKGYHCDLLNEFCLQWDGIKLSSGIIVVGMTNRPFDLDDVVLCWFSHCMLMDMPMPEEQHVQVVRLLADKMLDLPNLIDDLMPCMCGYL
ncbi:hypothetical protein AMAG_17817 [Allomyces macrogynus ATCC 38327]|uniref:ATPase AAA-type core domain-containing protein n=1 Tax=Allomyces macrogynus (strain ATCC 38327) TaxID=578462 RepID=A0A0L0S085_ALLM3|nr:hypothetical protein AMAG_17817 [Allomyces macrogynus ATCC 38327]|eukprot:KNE55744.1 hypothetical protein AMAG_17817 [Allomyces macrogynus ATCC 38327]